MRSVWLWSALATALSLALGALVVTLIENQWREQQRGVVQELAAAGGFGLQRQLDRSLSATFALATLLRQNKRIGNFEAIAADLIEGTGGLRSLHLAPHGQVAQSAPPTATWLVERPLREELPLDEPAQAALDGQQLALSRPVRLPAGGLGVVGVLPVFLPDDLGQERFWGLVAAVVGLDELLQASGLQQLRANGYAYRLVQLAPPGKPLLLAQEGTADLARPVSVELQVPNRDWQLWLAPQAGWPPSPGLGAEVGLVLLLGALMGGLTQALLRQPRLLRQQVALRTQELHRANAQLQRQMARLQAAEEALRKSEARYRDLFEQAGDAILTLDARGCFTALNRQAEDLVVQPRRRVLGQPAVAFVVPSQRRLARRAFVRTLRGHASRLELTLAAADQPGRVVELNARPFSTPDGQLGVQAIARDVSERKALERMRSEFVSTVSHELRTPLTSIKGFADLLQAGEAGALNDTQREFLDIVVQNTGRLVQLINDLLDLERQEAARLPLKCEPVALDAVLREVFQTFQLLAADKGLEFQLTAPAGLWVRGDQQRLVQAFANLVSNAVKYTERGRVWVTAQLDPATHRAVVEVGDSGIGISREDQARLFQRFFRSSHQVVRRAGGTGLGLAIAKATLERHGGQLSVRSKLGQGTTFSVTLPLILAPEGA